jgi:hypothetical protein
MIPLWDSNMFTEKGIGTSAWPFLRTQTIDYSENKEISDSRYDYDSAGRNKEANQFNARITYNWGTIWKQQWEFLV